MKANAVRGYRASGVAAGIKKKDQKDLGLIISDVPANVAGVFTQNRVQAAPVVLDQQRVKSGLCQAIIVNSGNANCCTGRKGMQDAEAMARLTAQALNIGEEQVLVASTGVIGAPLPIDRIEAAIPDLVAATTPHGLSDFAEAILTTDTAPKMVSIQDEIEGRSFFVTGIAKGAGMIRPNMATLLGFVISDIQAPAGLLQQMLVTAVDKSFNRITVDGDTSTNDTVLLMANGQSGVSIQDMDQQAVFQRALDDVMTRLAKMLIRDAEGATKLVEITVKGASSDEDARAVAETIAHSNLVKTALFGEDANWGRILAAAGRAGVAIVSEHIDIYFDDVQMVKGGSGCGATAEMQATDILRKPEFGITVDLHQGEHQSAMITCDFSIDYVKINADYRS